MSWTDEEIDNLFKDGANAQSFKYDDAYFAEMEAASLPVNKKGKDFLWMGTALLFVAVLTTGYFVNDTNENQFGTNNDQLANLELNTTTINGNTVDSNPTNNEQQSVEINIENELVNSISDADAASNDGVNTDRVNSASTKSNNSLYTSSQKEEWSKSIYNAPNANEVKSNPLAISKVAGGNSIGMSIDNQTSVVKPLVDLSADPKSNIKKQFSVVRGPITAGLDINSPNQLDQGIDQSLMPNALPVLSELRPKATLYFELNGGMSQSLITPSDDISKSFGGGVGVETYLGNFNLTTGLNFKVSDHNDLFLTRTGKVYGFGSTSGMNTYYLQKIYSLELPISLGYNFGKHNLNVGVRPSFIVGGKMKHQAFSDDKLLRTEKINGLLEGGLKNFGLKPTFGYAYRMNKWTVGANVGVQLMRSVNEDLIDGFNNTLPVDGQIYIRRTIRLRR